jgi:hypothetical protein
MCVCLRACVHACVCVFIRGHVCVLRSYNKSSHRSQHLVAEAAPVARKAKGKGAKGSAASSKATALLDAAADSDAAEEDAVEADEDRDAADDLEI